MGPKTKAALVGFGLGSLLGLLLAEYTMGKYRQDLFSDRPLRRLSALGYLSGRPSVAAVRLLHDYLAWERHPLLRRRARAILKRMEAALG